MIIKGDKHVEAGTVDTAYIKVKHSPEGSRFQQINIHEQVAKKRKLAPLSIYIQRHIWHYGELLLQ